MDQRATVRGRPDVLLPCPPILGLINDSRLQLDRHGLHLRVHRPGRAGYRRVAGETQARGHPDPW